MHRDYLRACADTARMAHGINPEKCWFGVPTLPPTSGFRWLKSAMYFCISNSRLSAHRQRNVADIA